MKKIILFLSLVSAVAFAASTTVELGGISVPTQSGNSGKVLSTDGSNLSWISAGGGGTGTVTSVDMSVPSFLSVSGNPITTSGTLAVTLAVETANTVFAGPTVGSATPTFRSLVAGDIPTLNQNTTGTASNITASSNSTLTTLSSLSLPGSQVTGNIAGNAANITASSNSTLTTLSSLSLPGAQVTGNISGNAANVTGVVAIAKGGTGQTTAQSGLTALLPSQVSNAGRFLTTAGVNAFWTTSITADLSTLGTGNHTGLWITGGATTKPTKLVLTNTNSSVDWSMVAFDSAHGPASGAFAITMEGNGQALWIDPSSLVVSMPSGSIFGGQTSIDGNKVDIGSAGFLGLNGSTSGKVSIYAADTTTDYSIKWPSAQGSASSVLQNDGAGNLTWSTGGTGASTALDNLTSPTAINQDLRPDTNLNYNLGSASASKSWNVLFVNGIYTPANSGAIDIANRSLINTSGDSILNWSALPFGSNGNVLSTDGAGNLSWSTAANDSLSNLASTAINTDLIWGVDVPGILKTRDKPTGNTTNLAISTGDPNQGVPSTSGNINLTTGSAPISGSQSGNINLISGASDNSGIITLASGNSTGTSGDVLIQTGTGGTRGKIKLVDGSEGTSGYVWMSTVVSGEGHWKNVGSQDLIFDTGGTANIQTKDNPSGNTQDLNITTGLPDNSNPSSSGQLTLGSRSVSFTGSTSGNVSLNSGATNASASGDNTIGSGDSISGSTGNIILRIGTTSGTMGKIKLVSQTTPSIGQVWTATNADSSGDWSNITTVGPLVSAILFENAVPGLIKTLDGAPSQDMTILSGDSNAAGQPSGGVFFKSGAAPGSTSTSGNTNISTGDADSDTGNTIISTGTVTGVGTKGKIKLVTATTPVVGYVWAATNTDSSGDWKSSGDIPFHIHSTSSAPSAAPTGSAGTGATCSVSNATDVAGFINFTAGIGATTGAMCNVTFNVSFGTAPICIFSAANQQSSSDIGNGNFVTSTTTDLILNEVAPITGNAQVWAYHCIETQ